MIWPAGTSEMAARMRAYDWAATSLGQADGWPPSLRLSVELLLEHPFPMALLWGDALVPIFNDPFARLLGQQQGVIFGRPQEAGCAEIHCLDCALVARIRAGEPVLVEDMLYRHAGSGAMEDHHYMIAHSPVRGETGQVEGILITLLETTKGRRAEHRVRQAEERQAFLLRLNDAVRPLTDPVEVQRTAMRMVNDRFGGVRSLFLELGPDEDTVVAAEGIDTSGHPRLAGAFRISNFGTRILELYAQGHSLLIEDRDSDPRIEAVVREAYRSFSLPALLGVPLHKHGKLVAIISVEFGAARPCTDEELSLLADVAQRVWDAVERARAESALRQSEERLRMMVAELQHRVRNILTVVRSVFTRTMEASGEREDMADHFRGRLDALARTQVIVTQTAAGTVDLENLIRDELISVGVSDGPNVRLVGPDVLLDSRTAESLGLAIHELTTNALKYGALKVEGGRLQIEWAVRADGTGLARLNLRWTEEGVPAISLTPLREGYGRELIEQALPFRLGAETSLEFRGGGVHCSISLPLANGRIWPEPSDGPMIRVE